MQELLQFDQWEDDPGCEHDGGRLAAFRLGNISMIADVREWINRQQHDGAQHFPILLEKVVYNGTHCGDWIRSSDAQSLLHELQVLSPLAEEWYQREFIQTMKQLCEASLASGNPIIF